MQQNTNGANSAIKTKNASASGAGSTVRTEDAAAKASAAADAAVKAKGAETNGANAVKAKGQMEADMAALEKELNGMSEEEMLDLFVENMIDEKGLAGTDVETRKRIKEDLEGKLVFEINRAIVAALPDEELEEFEKELDKKEPSQEVLDGIVAKAGLETDKIVEETMLDFRKVYLGAGEKAEG